LTSEPAVADSPGRVADVRFTSADVVPHRCFACGSLNEHGMHLVLHVQDDLAWTELELEDRFAGWDGIGHGGIVATILDEVMAWSLATSDAWGMTARMAVEFKRPVPTGTPLRAEARVTRLRRRIVDTEGRLLHREDGTVLATATGTYLAADPARQAELRTRYGFPIPLEATR
jgi:uncharacterized protein (TIGR00369 family)